MEPQRELPTVSVFVTVHECFEIRRRISSFSDESKNHVANDQSDKQSGYDGFGV
jgi:hypothetical protein